jgi:hypothetical protein
LLRLSRRHSARPALGLALALAAGLAVASPAAVATAASAPPTPAGLPAQVEPLATYVGQVSCDPAGKAGAVALGRLLTSTYPGTSYGVDRPCGNGGTVSEHYEGRAVDWMVRADIPAQRAQAEAVLNWLLATDAAGNKHAMARRLGVMYIIWDKRSFSLYRAHEGWKPYACSGITACHSDHIHLSLTWDGAMGRTSFWTKRVAPGTDFGPCRPADLNWAPRYRGANGARCASHSKVLAPAGATTVRANLVRFSGAELSSGSTGAAVSAVQSGLGIAADGRYAAGTIAAVTSLQSRSRLPLTGVMDQPTWRALLGSPQQPAPAPVPAPAPAIAAHYTSLGGAGSALGAPTTGELATPDRVGRFTHYANGSIYWTPATGAREVRGAIRTRWAAMGWERSAVGYPTTGELGTPDGRGRFNHFQGGSIYWTPAAGAHDVRGAIRGKWSALGWERSALGFPTTGELGTPDGHGRFNHFTNGSIYWTPPTGAREVRGTIRARWAALGWERSPLGYPTSDEYDVPGGRASDFVGGRITWDRATGATTVQPR